MSGEPVSAADIAIAKDGVRDTMGRYNMAGDSGRFADLAATFTHDGVLENRAWRLVGHAAILARMEALRLTCDPRLTLARHHLTTCSIDIVSPERATARSYFWVLSNIGPDHGGVYTDALRREGTKWLFERRRVRVEWAAPNTLFLLDDMAPEAAARGQQPLA
jgi:hypothetical protein